VELNILPENSRQQRISTTST